MLFIHTKKRSCIFVRNADKSLTSADCGQARNQCTKISVIPEDSVGRYLFRNY
jgi:hypothetical protein